MDMQSVSNLVIPEGEVRTIHDEKDNLLWGRVNYSNKYAGNTSQKTYTGKNLFLCPSLNSGTGITRNRLGDNSFNISVNSTGANQYTTVSFTLSPNTAYTFSFKKTISGTSSTNSGTVRPQIDGTYGSYHSSAFHFTTGATGETKFLFYSYSGNSSGSTIVNEITWYDIQLEVGSTTTSYEPFTDKIPSPNPDYPQAMDVVTGAQDVIVHGKNVWNMSSITGGNNVTITGPGTDGEYQITWTGGFNAIMSVAEGLDPDKTYTVSFSHKDEALSLRKVGSSTVLVSTEQDATYTRYTYSFTGVSSMPFEFIRRSATTNVSAFVKDFQIEVGAATDYEKYQSKKYELNLGKNLFDKNNPNMRAGYFNASATLASDGVVSDTSSTDRWIYLRCKPNTTYTITKPVTSTQSLNRFRVGTYPTIPVSGDKLSDFWRMTDGGNVSVHTITTGSQARYLCIYIAKASEAGVPGGEIQDVLDGIQIEESSSATSYSAYIAPTELCKIGNYQDYFYKSGDDWYIHKEIKKAVYNGAEDWQYITDVAGVERFTLYTSDIAFQSYTEDAPNVTVSDCFIGTNWYKINTQTAGDNVMSSHDNSRDLIIRCTKFSSVESFKTWLSTYNITVYYVLDSPTDTMVTDQAIISQLDNIHQWLVRYGYGATVSGKLPIIINRTTL